MRALMLVVAAACAGCSPERRDAEFESCPSETRVLEAASRLDSPDRDVRLRAERELATCGARAVPDLEAARTRVKTPEAQRRLDWLIARCVVLSWHTSLEEALAEATRTGRPILSVRLYGPAETPYISAECYFARRLLANRALREELARDFVLHWNPRPPQYVHESFSGQPLDDPEPLANGVQPGAGPALLIASPDGEIRHLVSCTLPLERFLEELAFARRLAAASSLDDARLLRAQALGELMRGVPEEEDHGWPHRSDPDAPEDAWLRRLIAPLYRDEHSFGHSLIPPPDGPPFEDR